MIESYKDIIVLLLIIVPYVVFIRNTYVDKNRETFNKAILAVAVGWALVVISAAVITGVDYLLASTEYETHRVVSGAVDRLIFAGLLGWVFPAFVIFFAWIAHLGIHKIRRRWFPHIVFKHFNLFL